MYVVPQWKVDQEVALKFGSHQGRAVTLTLCFGAAPLQVLMSIQFQGIINNYVEILYFFSFLTSNCAK